MTRYEKYLHALRWPLVVMAGLMQLILTWWVLPPELGGTAGLLGVIGFMAAGPLANMLYYLLALNYVAILLLILRHMFPQGNPIGPRLAYTSPPQRPAVLTAALMAATLSTGFVITLFESVDLWATIIYSKEFTTPESHFFRAGPGMAVALCAWAMWIAALGKFWHKGNRYQQMSVMLYRLAFCSMLLLIFAALVHGSAILHQPWVQHHYFGSYTGLILGLTVLIWCFAVWSIRLFFLPEYVRARELKEGLADEIPGRGYMSYTFRFIYFIRRLVFVAVAILMALVMWAVVTDILIRVPMGTLALKFLEDWTGYWLLPDHGIRGILGIYPASKTAHLGMSLVGFILYLVSQFLFEMPYRNYLTHLTQKGRWSWLQAMGVAMPAAGITVGAAAMGLEYVDQWNHYVVLAGDVSGRRHLGVILQPTFWFALPLSLMSYTFWVLLFRYLPLPGDYFKKRAQILYALFVAATIELFIAGMIQTVIYGYEGPFYDRGTFTSICICGAVTLWTLLPALRLTYAGQAYAAITSPMTTPAPPSEVEHS